MRFMKATLAGAPRCLSCARAETKFTAAVFFRIMSRRPIAVPSVRGIDWKALGYLTSILSVFFLGAAAWLKDHPPWWYRPALIFGMITSIVGMGFRYKSHLDEQREIRRAETEAEKSSGRTSDNPS